MKNHKKISLFFCMMLFLSNSLQSTAEPVHETKLILRSVELDICAILGYLSLCLQACENHFEKNNLDPKIQCKHCPNQLDFGGLVGNLVGMSLREMTEGKNNFNEYKPHFEDCLNLTTKESYEAAINGMIRVANATKQHCSHCLYQGSDDHWGKVEDAIARSGACDC
ncbi:hypothetical protein IPF37_05945 [bacterium]|nr:MAG: hypothetical protein IPF37_05945 [bacterium]